MAVLPLFQPYSYSFKNRRLIVTPSPTHRRPIVAPSSPHRRPIVAPSLPHRHPIVASSSPHRRRIAGLSSPIVAISLPHRCSIVAQLSPHHRPIVTPSSPHRHIIVGLSLPHRRPIARKTVVLPRTAALLARGCNLASKLRGETFWAAGAGRAVTISPACLAELCASSKLKLLRR